MPESHPRSILAAALLFPLLAVPFASTPRQEFQGHSARLSITPPEATLHLGEKQSFRALVRGTQTKAIQWVVEESSGGQITESGIYTAPLHMGLYHVVAISEENPDARAVAKITVVTEYDTPGRLGTRRP